MNTDDNQQVNISIGCRSERLSIGCRSERHAIEQLFLKVFGAVPVYPDPAPTERPTRQYYYSNEDCTACSMDDPNCICWHDEGTGPLANDPASVMTWRDRPATAPSEKPPRHIKWQDIIGMPIWNGIGQPGSVMPIPEDREVLTAPLVKTAAGRFYDEAMRYHEGPELIKQAFPVPPERPTPRTAEFHATVKGTPLEKYWSAIGEMEKLERELAELVKQRNALLHHCKVIICHAEDRPELDAALHLDITREFIKGKEYLPDPAAVKETNLFGMKVKIDNSLPPRTGLIHDPQTGETSVLKFQPPTE